MNPFDIIAELRKRGYTQTRLARELETKASCVGNVIHGRHKSLRTAKYVAGLLGKEVDDLWPGKYDYCAKRSTVVTPIELDSVTTVSRPVAAAQGQ
ncbi:MAG: helix-turn-helix domain-containing protein [Burkholderiales bacterium]|nr:helix-turn-helix domain-containing protein [Burkholderiales bacterium]